MLPKQEVIAMILAGGQGSRLGVLTRTNAKPAVPYGGKYRIIDFPLSNCANSGIETVGVLTQYQPLELNEYIGTGPALGLRQHERRRARAAAVPAQQRLPTGTRARQTPFTRISRTLSAMTPSTS